MTFDQYYISWEGRSKAGDEYSGSDVINKNAISYVINNTINNGTLNVQLWTKKGENVGNSIYLDAYAAADEGITFFMPVEDTYKITGKGVVATGKISRGIIYPNDSIQVVGLGSTSEASILSTTITGIEMFNKPQTYGAAGDNVGLLLGSNITSKDQIKRGMLVCKPGEITPHKKFKAYIYLYSTAEGGGSTGVTSGYRPQYYLQTTDITGTTTFSGTINPGEEKIVEVERVSYAGLFPGEEFKIREGGYIRGYGTILEIIE